MVEPRATQKSGESDKSTESDSRTWSRLLVGFLTGLALTGLPMTAAWGADVFEQCVVSLAFVPGVVTPPADAGTRWYTSRALVVVGVTTLFVVAFVDPLAGDTDFLLAVATILLGAGVSQTAPEE